MRTCVTGCTQPADGYYLCHTCTHQLVTELRRVPDLVRQLTIVTSRQTHTETSIGVTSRNANTPLPVNLTASDTTRDLNNVLTTWATDIAHRVGTTLDSDDATTAATWLLNHQTTIRTHPYADQLHDEITDATRRGWRLVDRPPEKRFIGPCACGADLHARPHDANIQCGECGTRFDAIERRAWLLDQARDQLETASTIARALPGLLGHNITPAMIRGYVHRGRLAPRPPDRAGHTRFRVGDVIDLVLYQ